jgi:N-acetylmuramic acid 6-phosphate etherase
MNPPGRRNPRKRRIEGPNPAVSKLDLKSSAEIADIINAADATVAPAVKRALPQIARAIDLIAAGLRKGGRLIYVGAGSSGRIAALDAVECPPTFNTDPRTVQFVIAGGPSALVLAVEAAEDSRELGEREMAKKNLGKNDVVVGIAASGHTPFTVAAMEYARRHGAQTIAVTCNPNSPLERAANMSIVTEVGSEVIAGSSRMKAGTAQKMVLNMLSTAAMTRLGYVYGGLMVNVHLKNAKLRQRGIGILRQITGTDHDTASGALEKARNRLPVALVMLQAGVTRAQAERALRATSGHVRKAVAYAARNQ